MEEFKFFEYGKIKLSLTDFKTRMVVIDISIPCCLFQTVTPQLLHHGWVDNLRIREPMAVWLPKLLDEHFKNDVKGVSEKVNATLKEEALRTSNLFMHLKDFLNDPSDVVPLLPLGVYLDFSYRCSVDSIINLLQGVNSIMVTGVPEFQWALASALNLVLTDFDKVDKKALTSHT